MMFQNNPRFLYNNQNRLLIVYHDTKYGRYDMDHTCITQNIHPHRPYDSPVHCLYPAQGYAK